MKKQGSSVCVVVASLTTGLIAGTIAASVFSARNARASESGNPPAFSACSDVTMVATDQERDDYEKSHPACLAATDPVLGRSNLSVVLLGMDSATALNVKMLWQKMLKEQYEPDLESKLAYWKDVGACLGSSDCARHDQIKSVYGKLIHKLRIDLALANIASQSGTPVLKAFSNSQIKKMKNQLPNLFPAAVTGDLTPEELQAVKAKTASGNLKQIQAAARAAYLKDLMTSVNGGEYLVALLPKPSADSSEAEWTPEQWSKTMGQLESHAEAEKARIDQVINKDPADLDTPPFTPDEFARLRYEMNKYLSKPGHYTFCGTAQAADSWSNSKQDWDTAAMFASFALTGGAAGADVVLAKDAAESAGARLAMLGSTAVGAAGGAYGVALTANEIHEEHQNGTETFNDIAQVGVEQGKEVDTQSVKAVEAALQSSKSALHNAVIGNAEMAGSMFAGTAAVGVAAKAIVKAMTRDPAGKEAIAKLLLMSDDPQKVIEALKVMPGKAAQKQALLANIKDADDAIAAQKVLKDQFSVLKQQMKPADLDEVSGLVNQLVEKEKTQLMIERGCEGMSESACMQVARKGALQKVRQELGSATKECGLSTAGAL